MRKRILILAVVILTALCGSSQTLYTSKPSSPALMKGKGILSFKTNGLIHKSDSTQTKCWTSERTPVAMLWAKGQNVNVSWQIQNIAGKGNYRIDKDSKGTINITIGNKTYWIRKTDGSNYLNVVITGIREMYGVKLLSGSFEGVVEDKNGNKLVITEGKFVTDGI
jgi:hypothetical protein